MTSRPALGYIVNQNQPGLNNETNLVFKKKKKIKSFFLIKRHLKIIKVRNSQIIK
jgi:hypothetical protein